MSLNSYMTIYGLPIFFIVGIFSEAAWAGPPASRFSLSLNGRWLAKAGTGEEDYWKSSSRSAGWVSVTIPSRNWPTQELNDAKVVWTKTTIHIPAKFKDWDAVLHWGRIRWGVKAWINGKEVGERIVVSPHHVLLPRGIFKPGPNLIVFRVGGWASVPKKENIPLIPAGFPRFGHKRHGGIFGDVWLEFYRRVHIKDILMMPDVKARKVTARIWLDSIHPLTGKAEITCTIVPWKGKTVVGSESVTIDLESARWPLDLVIPVPEAKLWTPESPNLYTARFELRLNGRTSDRTDIRFGMRELKIVRGHYQLNGKPYYFRGYNLMWQWYWSDDYYNNPTTIKGLLVDFARGMNACGFRTHTSAPPDNWLNMADENGILLLSEFPMTLNYNKWPFSRDEWEIYQRNGLLDALGWVRAQWNHPSVVMWVPTNEFNAEAEWQTTTLFDAIKALDPTRPIMRSSESTPDLVDIHCYKGFWRGAEGDFYKVIEEKARNRDPGRPLSNTEFVENFTDARRLRWNGTTATDRQATLVYAQFVAEQTESMRRLRYDGIFPYCCSGNEPGEPNYEALHSSLAPVAVSIDLFNRNFSTGQTLSTQVYLINDTPEPQDETLQCYISKKNPEFLTSKAFIREALFKKEWKVKLSSSSILKQEVNWPLPRKEGKYFLAAVLTAEGKKPVVSQRIVRVLDDWVPHTLKFRRVVVLGSDATFEKWLKKRGLCYRTSLGAGLSVKKKPDSPATDGLGKGDVLAVWEAKKISAAERAATPQMLKFVREGGKIVIFPQASWDWKELADFEVGKARCSRAFWSKDAQHPLRQGLDGQYFRRWNGFEGVVAEGSLDGEVRKRGEILMWMEKPGTAVLLSVPLGKGEIIISQLAVKNRIQRDSLNFDPVAERLLLALLETTHHPRGGK